MKVVIVTGTPGTGKTVIAKKLASKLQFHYIDANKIIKKYDISEGYDKKRKTKIIDVKKLNKALIKEINNYKKSNKEIIKKANNKLKKHSNKKTNYKKIKITDGIIIDSHLSHYLPKKYVDLCVVTKCDLKKLKKRLEKRKYTKAKIRENLDAEIFDICLSEAREKKHKVMILDTAKKVDIKEIITKIKK